MPEISPQHLAMLLAVIAEQAAQLQGLKRALIDGGVISEAAYQSAADHARQSMAREAAPGFAVLEMLERLQRSGL